MAIKCGVSFYSYQRSYFNGTIDLEGMVAAVHEAGATGIQLMPEQTPVGRYPHTYPRDVGMWKELMAKYETEPVCLDSSFNTAAYKGQLGTAEEQREVIEAELQYAAAFGFKAIRYPVNNFHRQVIEDILPLAEEYGVSIGMEIHVPMHVPDKIVQNYLEMIERTGSKYASIIPDLAIYSTGVNAVSVDNYLREGAREDLVREVCEAYAARQTPQQIVALADKWNASETERAFILWASRGTNGNVEDLRPYVKYISNVHGKCYKLNENCEEPGIDTPGVVRLLKEEGYDGYICTEFEAIKAALPKYADEIDEIEQVRRHQVLLHRLINE